jgi:hypothetical protein
MPTLPAGTAAEASTTDPIFAAIEVHQVARALTVAASDADDHDKDALNAPNEAETDRLAELLAMTPVTLAGCAAMMRYVEAYLRDEDYNRNLFSEWADPWSEPGATLLSRLAAVIEQAGA